MIRITAKPGNRLDTIATSAVKSALAGAESDVDTPNTSGARSLIRRALADLPHHAAALPNGDIAMKNRHGLVIVATWSTCEALIHQGAGCGCGYVTMDQPNEDSNWVYGHVTLTAAPRPTRPPTRRTSTRW